MIQLSPPSPEVRAAVKMASIAGIIVGAQVAILLLNQYFTVEQIIEGIAAGLVAGTFYMMFQLFVDQERHQDDIKRISELRDNNG